MTNRRDMAFLELFLKSVNYLDLASFLGLFLLRFERATTKLVLLVVGIGLATVLVRYGLNLMLEHEVLRIVLRFGWYLSFAFVSLVAFFWISSTALSESIFRSWLVKIIITSFFYKGCLHIARYVDRFVLETHALDGFYQVSLALAIALCSLALLLYVIKRVLVSHGVSFRPFIR